MTGMSIHIQADNTWLVWSGCPDKYKTLLLINPYKYRELCTSI